MNESEAAHVRQHVRVYVMVFVALAVLTVVTVTISYLHLPTALAISVALAVATVKAGLVAGYFMHLLSEEKVIVWLLLLCAAFFVFLMALPVGTQTGIAPLWPLSRLTAGKAIDVAEGLSHSLHHPVDTAGRRVRGLGRR